MSEVADTLRGLLEVGGEQAPAILSPGKAVLEYGSLRNFVGRLNLELKSLGVSRGDRVAIVLPNGPEMALCFLAVATHCAAAPLNPAYREEEFDFFLADLKARLLIVAAGDESPAITVAERLGIPVARMEPTPAAGTGTFRLDARSATAAAAKNEAGELQPGDVALVLHTSGTTSRPKIVPLTQRNICLSAANVSASLRLTPEDRGLQVMPLFHIHGLIAGLLAPLSKGSAACCTPGFDALHFFRWMAECKPSWYTAVPTMHQTVLARASRNAEIISANPLRFIRSSSSALPTQVIAQLESMFGAPVIEAYGMTEAAHQMASNPLPPGVRKPGTVGPGAGPEIAIMDHAGQLLAPGSTGEIVIRGANITNGYENNPEANNEAFTHGWFRTGDQGVMDEEGYVTITGRLKEIINRGGEKVSPREIDEVLMDHPAVAQVVAFAVPHQKLGEEVAVAVVLREGATVTEGELRQFTAKRLAPFKVPRTVVFLEEIPKGPTGKLQRIGLAQKLGLA